MAFSNGEFPLYQFVFKRGLEVAADSAHTLAAMPAVALAKDNLLVTQTMMKRPSHVAKIGLQGCICRVSNQ